MIIDMIKNRKLSRIEVRFLRKACTVFSNPIPNKDKIEKLLNWYEKSMNKVGIEPIVSYRFGEINLKNSGYNFNSTYIQNSRYIVQLLQEDISNPIKSSIIATIIKLMICDKIEEVKENE